MGCINSKYNIPETSKDKQKSCTQLCCCISRYYERKRIEEIYKQTFLDDITDVHI